MLLQGIIIFFLTIGRLVLCYDKADMAINPILDYLNMDPGNVIEHEFIKIDILEHMHKRDLNIEPYSETRMRIRAFGEDINLWLHPRDSLLASELTPVFYINPNGNKSGGVEYVLQEDIMRKLGTLLEDPDELASLVIGKDENDLPRANGNIRIKGENTALVIRFLPEYIVGQHLKNHPSITYYGDQSSGQHIILKVKDYFDNNYPDMANNRTDNETYVNYPDIIYPKIFVNLDSTYYVNGEEAELLRSVEYALAFWNGVDLYYRHLENPKIRLHITAIAIGTEPSAVPYFNSSMFEAGLVLNHIAGLFRASRFFYNISDQIPLHTYDIAAIQTKYKMLGTTLGVSLDGACQIDMKKKLRRGVVIVRDNGVFSGLFTAAHEIGHAIGLDHDNITVSPECDEKDGYIMTDERNPTNKSTSFSNCSLAQFDKLLLNASLSCMYDPPVMQIKNLPKPMPGKVASLYKQCAPYGPQGPCSPPEQDDICVNLRCNKSFLDANSSVSTTCISVGHGAAPGTPCGNYTDDLPRFCLQSRCVSI